MPPKKRRFEVKDEDEIQSLSGVLQAKKKKKILNYDPHEIIQELYDTIRNHKTSDGRLLCEALIRVPKRRTAADYYEVVSTPIDMLKIQQKIKTDGYDYVDQLSDDVALMVSNAKAYYKKTSAEYKDACDLLYLYESTRADLVESVFEGGLDNQGKTKRLLPTAGTDEDMDQEESEEDDGEECVEETDMEAGRGKPKSMSPEPEGREDTYDDLEQLFSAIATTKDGDRDITTAFQLLPPRAKYPQYYEVITNPIDLKTIATRIQKSKYKNLEHLEKDLLLMVKNAKIFNEPKSLIYRDALTLKRIITERRRELEYKKTGHVKTSSRLRTKEKTVDLRLSAKFALLKYRPFEENEMSGQDDSEDQEDNSLGMEDEPQWILYNHVRNYTSADDSHALSDPFYKLPSKKLYPDYYHEIKKPTSLKKIEGKISINDYVNVLDVARDIHLLFRNARTYNKRSSQLYKDAVELDGAMLEKLRELDESLANELVEEIKKEREEEEYEEEEEEEEEEHEEEEEKEEGDEDMTPVKRERKPNAVSLSTPDSVKRRKKSEEIIRKRLKALFHCVYDYKDINGRLLRPIFMVLPSRKDYPDYYKVITEPIDLSIIETKLNSEKYLSEQSLLSDFELMFNNARHYNEEGSQVYQDANTLDKTLKAKWRYLQQSAKMPGQRGRPRITIMSNPLSEKLLDLFETVRNYQDRTGRALSSPFVKAPNKQDYPDYYEVIKRPMDLQRIQQKMLGNQYDNIEEMVADFVQMFDNACKYNEPESVIYKDALTLQRICFQKKLDLLADSMHQLPDVRALVQELMKNMFITTYNYEDDEGRCYSDSFQELVEDKNEAAERPLSFDQIKKNLDKGRYRRVDRFQDDMFKVFERARHLSRTDSQLYEDAVELQQFFVKTRDELCKNGEFLLTPALSYTQRHLTMAVEAEQKIKAAAERLEDEEKKKQTEEKTEEVKAESVAGEDECEFKDQIYSCGQFVYIHSRDSPEPHIMVIESFTTDEAGQPAVQGSWFYRPNETYHVATRKFLEKEVFKSDIISKGTPMSEIIGRCCVMFVKDYFKTKPEETDEKDVYVCESRYSTRHRSFKKIKVWPAASKKYTFVSRLVPITPTRVASVFVDKQSSESHLDESDSSIDKYRESVVVESENGNTYYDQLVVDNGCFKLGDGVYICNPSGGGNLIARIDKMWTDTSGQAFFHYACFLRPSDIEHAPTRLFYKAEVFQGTMEDCALIKNIVGKCCILHLKDYCSSRPTEIQEQDVYVNECKYSEGEKSIKRQKLLKKYALSPKVIDDEIYFFRKPLTLEKEPSPLLMKSEELLSVETEEILEVEAETNNDLISVDAASPAPQKSNRKKAMSTKRQASGYIMFAGEVRKQIINDNPNASFGDISRIVGTKWKSMTKTEKDVYEDKARKHAEESATKQQEADKTLNESINESPSPWLDTTTNSSTPVSTTVYPNHISSGPTVIPLPCPPSPVFVTVPAQTNKLMHSESYLRYIEGLVSESPTICDWNRSFQATQENTPTQAENKLPGHWLGHGAGQHGTVTSALWALRDVMMRDAFNISRTVVFDDL